MRYYLAVLFLVVLFLVPYLAVNFPGEVNYAVDSFQASMQTGADEIAAVVTHNPRTVAGLQSKYNEATTKGTAKVRVLLVPGHEPDYGGAEYGDVKERDLTPIIADDLATMLRNTGKYEVYVSRDVTGQWNPLFATYFDKNWNAITDWEQSYRKDMSKLISLGLKHNDEAPVEHIDTPIGPATRLYGLTKWANENDIDMIIHIHLNDYPGHGTLPGKYNGFGIYVPSSQYDNSATTHAIADTVFKRLAKYNPVSDLPIEASGIIDDPELIAVGAHNTSDAPSMLIEYAYIYEQEITNPKVRSTALKDFAYQTFLGLQDFFDPTNTANSTQAPDTVLLPHAWQAPVNEKNGTEVYTLQTALLKSGVYPPAQKDLNDCPRTGTFGPCTLQAVQAFQKKYGITGENGVGPKTRAKLNEVFGTK